MSPSHDTHEAFDELVLGEEHEEIHDLLDATAPITGPNHREDPIHSLEAAAVYAALTDDMDALESAALHLAADELIPPGGDDFLQLAFEGVE